MEDTITNQKLMFAVGGTFERWHVGGEARGVTSPQFGK